MEAAGKPSTSSTENNVSPDASGVNKNSISGRIKNAVAQKNNTPDGVMRSTNFDVRFSTRDTKTVPEDIARFVDDSFSNRRNNGDIVVSYASAWDNKAINRLGNHWQGKYTGSERTITSEYVRHIVNQHGNALTEALRGQLYMDADAIKIALTKLREGKGRIVEGTSSRRGNPTITTEIPINGYTIYVEEPMSGLSATSLEGRTMYLMPTSTTALVQGNKPVNIPQRRSGLKPIIDASNRIVNGNLSGSDGKPIRLHTVDFQSPEFNANRANGVYCMSTDIDALNTTNQPVNTGEFFAAIKNPYIVTAANPIITDEDIRNGLVANRISEVKRAG